MKLSRLLTVVGVGCLLMLPVAAHASQSAAAARPTTAQVDDDTLESNVEAVFKKDSILAPRDLDVESTHGVITLTGSVRTAAERARAGRLAKVPGVSRVINHIEVDPNIDRSKTDAAARKTKEGLNKAVDATVAGAKKAKEGVQKGVGASAKGVGTGAARVTDASITTAVKTNLAKDTMLDGSAIAVETADHVVTLRGTVASDAAKARAAAVAAKTSGVTRVVNDLVVQ